MPLTSRPGVIRLKISDRWAWYAIDPESNRAARPAAEWVTEYGPTNTRMWRRVLGRIVGWGSFVAGAVAIVYGVIALAVANNIGVLVAAVLLAPPVLVIVSLLAGTGISGSPAGGMAGPELVAVPEPIVKWAGEHTTAGDLWQLVFHYRRVADIVHFPINWDDDRASVGDEWFKPEVDALLRGHYQRELPELQAIADRLGFPIPAFLLVPPGLTPTPAAE